MQRFKMLIKAQAKGQTTSRGLQKMQRLWKLKEAHSFSYLNYEVASNCVFSHMFLTLQKNPILLFSQILVDLLFFKEIHYLFEVCHTVFSFHVHEHTVRGWLDRYVQKSIYSWMIENLCHFLRVIKKERKALKHYENNTQNSFKLIYG